MPLNDPSSTHMKTVWPLPSIDYMPFAEIEESREVAVITSKQAFDAVRDLLPFKIVWFAEVIEASEAHWLDVSRSFQGDVLYAIGGGLSVDAAKYIASVYKIPLICLPTALTADAFFTWASGVRKNGCVVYLQTTIPDRLIVDFDVLSSAPPPLRAAGICDVLSIATGSWDWNYAEGKGMNPPGYELIPFAYHNAHTILDAALECAEAAGHGDREGLNQLIQCLAMEVQLCNLIGHSRPEEGSEHYFAYCVENLTGKGLPHGDLVGPGILLAARWQGQETIRLKEALQHCHVPLNRIPRSTVRETIQQLPVYCKTHRLLYGIAHELTEATNTKFDEI